MTKFQEKWVKALGNMSCGKYYSKKPCRAHSSNIKDDYCAAHKKLDAQYAAEKKLEKPDAVP